MRPACIPRSMAAAMELSQRLQAAQLPAPLRGARPLGQARRPCPPAASMRQDSSSPGLSRRLQGPAVEPAAAVATSSLQRGVAPAGTGLLQPGSSSRGSGSPSSSISSPDPGRLRVAVDVDEGGRPAWGVGTRAVDRHSGGSALPAPQQPSERHGPAVVCTSAAETPWAAALYLGGAVGKGLHAEPRAGPRAPQPPCAWQRPPLAAPCRNHFVSPLPHHPWDAPQIFAAAKAPRRLSAAAPAPTMVRHLPDWCSPGPLPALAQPVLRRGVRHALRGGRLLGLRLCQGGPLIWVWAALE